jgi:flavin-dependent dehydrogenase
MQPPIDGSDDFDVVVVGAGSAGAAAAGFLAAAGRRVALTDVRPFGGAGARWVNGVPPWMFDRAGVARPEPPERRPGGAPFTLLGPDGRRHLTLEPNPVWSVDMRLLVDRLQRAACAAGATPFERFRLVEVELEGGRPRAIVVEQREPAVVGRRLTARLFVDASGLAGVLRRRVPPLDRHCPPVPRMHLCSAAQAVHHVRDPAAARRFLERHEARPGEILGRVGVSGGYSVGNVLVMPDLAEVDLLSGAIAQPQYLSGPAILEEIRAREPWIGEAVFGGASALPLRRPYDRLSAPGVALVGNAACQVFPAHGSGIGTGLIAARLLADAVGGADDPGGEDATWAYQHAFHRELGGLLGAYDLLRRFSQSLSAEDTAALLGSGLVSHPMYAAGLEQRLCAPDLAAVTSLPLAAARAPRLAVRLAPFMARVPAAVALYRMHPERPDRRALARWSAHLGRLFGEAPDVAA